MSTWKRLKRLASDATEVALDYAERRVTEFRNPPALPDAAAQWDRAALYQGEGAQSWTAEDIRDVGQQLAQQLNKSVSGAPTGERQGLYWDPYTLIEQLGYRDKPSPITYKTLEQMVFRVPFLQAIIQTRINQVAAFCVPQPTRFDHGFRVGLRDSDRQPSKADKKKMKELEQWLYFGGYVEDCRQRGTFEDLMRKSVRDSLVFDQVNWEVVPDNKGRPAAWYVLDPSTIRLADTYRLYPSEDLDDIKTVQIYDEVVINSWPARGVTWEIRNPRSSIQRQGYGTSEVEMAVNTITQFLWATTHNSNYFKQGSAIPGLLNLKGAIPEKHMQAFRREWYQLVAGVEQAHRQPIVNAEGIEWIPMHKSNRDMEFAEWLDFLIKIIASIFLMDPIEVGFKYGSGGGSRAMFGSADKTKSIESKQKGLKPILRFFEGVINRNLIWPIDPDFNFEFVGLEQMTPKELADLQTQRVRSLYTVNEMRAEHDKEPIPDGDVILDANYLAHVRGKRELAMKEQEQAALMSPGMMNAAGNDPGNPSKPQVGRAQPNVGEVDSDPATESQVKELETLLQPSVAKSRDMIAELLISNDIDMTVEEALDAWDFTNAVWDEEDEEENGYQG